MEKQYYYLVDFFVLDRSRRLSFIDRFFYSLSGSTDLARMEFLARKRCRSIEIKLRKDGFPPNSKVFYTYSQKLFLPKHESISSVVGIDVLDIPKELQ